MLQPTPATIAADPVVGVAASSASQPAQSRTIVTACRLAPSLERIAQVSADEADRRLRSVRGIGVWTSAEVRQRALGDADAVSFGDYHLANWVGWALVGHDVTDDEMAELLEPYRPQRGRRPARWRSPAASPAAARAADEHPDATCRRDAEPAQSSGRSGARKLSVNLRLRSRASHSSRVSSRQLVSSVRKTFSITAAKSGSITSTLIS